METNFEAIKDDIMTISLYEQLLYKCSTITDFSCQSWMRQQLAVMRTKQAGDFDNRLQQNQLNILFFIFTGFFLVHGF